MEHGGKRRHRRGNSRGTHRHRLRIDHFHRHTIPLQCRHHLRHTQRHHHFSLFPLHHERLVEPGQRALGQEAHHTAVRDRHGLLEAEQIHQRQRLARAHLHAAGYQHIARSQPHELVVILSHALAEQLRRLPHQRPPRRFGACDFHTAAPAGIVPEEVQPATALAARHGDHAGRGGIEPLLV